MGRRKNNPELVQELIDGRWTMDQDEFEKKYFSLSSSDMWKVGEAIDGMEDEFFDEDEEEQDVVLAVILHIQSVKPVVRYLMTNIE